MILLQVSGQTGKPIHPHHKAPVLQSEKPVTEREAREAFAKVGQLLLKVNGRTIGDLGMPLSDRAVTREEIVSEMARIYQAAEATIRFVPSPVKYDPKAMSIATTSRAHLERLVSLGFVGRVGPLAVGPGSSLTPRQFGDALGLFVDRMAQITHLPSPKWTPMLKED